MFDASGNVWAWCGPWYGGPGPHERALRSMLARGELDFGTVGKIVVVARRGRLPEYAKPAADYSEALKRATGE